MTYALIVIGLLVLGAAAVVWAVRKKPAETRTGPREGDTAWNDPISSADPEATPTHRPDGAAGTPPPTNGPRP